MAAKFKVGDKVTVKDKAGANSAHDGEDGSVTAVNAGPPPTYSVTLTDPGKTALTSVPEASLVAS